MTKANSSTSPIDYTNEQWKDIPGYEGYYQVSDMGRVRSLSRIVDMIHGGKYPVRGKILKPILKKDTGYYAVGLLRDGARQVTIHSLVALCFIGPLPDGYHTHHKDDNKKNNRADNLEYLTPAEHNGGDNNGMAKYTEGDYAAALALLATGKYTYAQIEEKTGMSGKSLKSVIGGKRRTDIKVPPVLEGDLRTMFYSGQDNRYAKLTNTQVRKMRNDYATGNFTYKELGKKYGIHYRNVGKIIRKEMWKSVD